MQAIPNSSTNLYSRIRAYGANAFNDRLPLKGWHRTVSFAVQVILYAYSIPGMFGTLMMGHLDYPPDELGRILQNLALLIVFAMVLNVVVRSRRGFLAYLGYGALTNVLLIVGALSCMAIFT